MNDPLPPRHVAIAGSVVLAAAIFVLSLIPMATYSDPFLVFRGVVLLILSWGIFVGRRFPWGWCLLIGLFTLIDQGAELYKFYSFAWAGTTPDSVHEAMIRWLIIVLVLYVGSVACFGEGWSLQQKERYGDKPKASPETKRLIACVAAVSVVFSFLYQAKDWWGSETLRQVYEIETRLIPYDDETGEPIEELSFSKGQKHPGDREKVTLPYFNAWEETITEDGKPRKTVVIKGFASNRFPASVSSSGYEAGLVTLDRDSPKEIRVPLKRKK